ncbi:MAG TPA: pyrroline-5-carboxylate reductase [Deltaproteobacteria bacterium]|nr:pyrroline-5-carboxylate reductase [Deltaproteobacteria bacterium]HPR52826.1 pyrroline-5-carboxylate reductase [Deltaproteobacteria bacterium]
MRSIGFIGAGNMAEAIIGGIVKKGLYEPSEIMIHDVSQDRLDFLSSTFGVVNATGPQQLLAEVPIVILAVKPAILPVVVNESKELLAGKLVISIAAGIPIDTIVNILGDNARVIRVMPNTPALIGEGASALASSQACSSEDIACAKSIFSAVGMCIELEERLINAVTALSGSGPAFCFMFIEALSDGGVRSGLPRDTALALAAATLKGAAGMVLETGKHPGVLKDMVTSPSGTTIEGVSVLESRGFRSAVTDAVHAAYKRACDLAK